MKASGMSLSWSSGILQRSDPQSTSDMEIVDQIRHRVLSVNLWGYEVVHLQLPLEWLPMGLFHCRVTM